MNRKHLKFRTVWMDKYDTSEIERMDMKNGEIVLLLFEKDDSYPQFVYKLSSGGQVLYGPILYADMIPLLAEEEDGLSEPPSKITVRDVSVDTRQPDTFYKDMKEIAHRLIDTMQKGGVTP